MSKTSKNLKLTVYLALLTAISIICGKYLAIRGGDVMRFSLENMPIIFAGVAFGPLAGGAVGLVADLVGCLMVSYTINPLVALGAASIGVVSGGVSYLLKRTKIDRRFITAISVAAAHLIGSVIIKTVGLASYYDMPFAILMIWRVINYVIVGTIDGFVLHILLKNKEIQRHVRELGGKNDDLRGSN